MLTLAEAPLPHLERQVLELIAEGHEDPEVAAQLGLKNPALVRYRLARIACRFRLDAVVRPQLVDYAYTHGALPTPVVLQPLVLEANAYDLVRTLAAGEPVNAYARRLGLKPYQADYLLKATRARLGATSRPSMIRRAWQRQVLGPTPFAADLGRMYDEGPQPPGAGRWVIVPLLSGYRLAGPADGLQRTRHLDVPDQEAADAAARFLSGRAGFAPLWTTKPPRPGDPVRVSWGRSLPAVLAGPRVAPVRPPRHAAASASPSMPDRRAPASLLPRSSPARTSPMCEHPTPCPSANSPDREAAKPVAPHPEQGWTLLCNGVLLFEDTGELLPDGSIIAPHRGLIAAVAA